MKARLSTKLCVIGGVFGYAIGLPSCWPLAPAFVGLWYGNVYTALTTNEICPLSKAGTSYYRKNLVFKKDKEPRKYWINVFAELFLGTGVLILLIKHLFNI